MLDSDKRLVKKRKQSVANIHLSYVWGLSMKTKGHWFFSDYCCVLPSTNKVDYYHYH